MEKNFWYFCTGLEIECLRQLKGNKKRYSLNCIFLAEREGFEPSIGFPIHAFQACALSHYATSPVQSKYYSRCGYVSKLFKLAFSWNCQLPTNGRSVIARFTTANEHTRRLVTDNHLPSTVMDRLIFWARIDDHGFLNRRGLHQKRPFLMPLLSLAANKNGAHLMPIEDPYQIRPN